MKKYSLLLGVLVASLLLSSCKDYLDIKPYGQTIPKTPEEFEALLHSVLNNIEYGKEAHLIGHNSAAFQYETHADNLDANLTKYPAGNILNTYVGSDIMGKSAAYTNLYAIIRDCNIVIDNLDDSQNELTVKVLATAYAMRGVAYYKLLLDFCEPYDAENPDQIGMPSVYSFDMEHRPMRSKLRDNIRYIENDYLRSLSYKMDDELYFFTQDVVKAYLARLYFFEENWEKTIPYAKNLLTEYPLVDKQEYIDMMTSRYAKMGNMLFRSMIYKDASSELNITSIMNSSKARPASREFVLCFAEKERDVRYTLSFNKWLENEKLPIACLRTDEMCLQLAESYAHLGKADSAMYYLNHLREKRITDYVPLTAATLPVVDSASLIKVDATNKALTPLMQAIHNERRKELYMEGDRWWELKRNGTPEFWTAKDGFKFTTEKFLYTAPIPKVDVELTPGLVQNQGYN